MFLLTTPSSWQMIHTQHLSCQKIPPGVPPTLATLSIKLDCSIEESHHSHGWGKTVMSLHNCTSPTVEGAGRREGGEKNIQNSSQVWQAAYNYHTFTPLMWCYCNQKPYLTRLLAKGETGSEDVYCLWPWVGQGVDLQGYWHINRKKWEPHSVALRFKLVGFLL